MQQKVCSCILLLLSALNLPVQLLLSHAEEEIAAFQGSGMKFWVSLNFSWLVRTSTCGIQMISLNFFSRGGYVPIPID